MFAVGRNIQPSKETMKNQECRNVYQKAIIMKLPFTEA
jgi:hypothetical protein